MEDKISNNILKILFMGILITISIFGFSTKVEALTNPQYFNTSTGTWTSGRYAATEAEKNQIGAYYSLEQALNDLNTESPYDAKYIPMRHSWMRNRRDIYCLAHDRPFNGNRMYVALAHVFIDGNYIQDGILQGQIKYSEYNGQLAYILSLNQGYGSEVHAYTDAAKCVYSLSTKWLKECADIGGLASAVAGNDAFDAEVEGMDIMKQARSYAQTVGTLTGSGKINAGTSLANPTLKDNTDYSKVTSTQYLYASDNISYIRVGPFKFDYSIPLSDITVSTNIGECTRSANYGDSHKLWVGYFDGTTERWVAPSELPANREIYLTFYADAGITEINSIHITGSKSQTVYYGDVWLLQDYKNQHQNLLYSQIKGENKTANLDVTLHPNFKITKSLRVRKADSDTNEPLRNVGFVLRNKNLGRWIKYQNGVVSYVESRNDATEFVTGADGSFTVPGLVVGNYEAYETKNPNPGYVPLSEPVQLTLDGNDAVIEKIIGNDFQFGNLILDKVDKDRPDKKLANVKFTLRQTVGRMAGKYVTVDANGNAQYSDNVGYLVTDINGHIEVDGLWIGNYELKEVDNPNYGYLVDSTSINVSIQKRQDTSKIIPNENQLGNLVIEKQDKDDPSIKLKQVKFTLRQTSGQMTGKYVTVNSNGEAQYSDSVGYIITNDLGRIEISKLWRGDYELQEIENPNYGYIVNSDKINLTINRNETTTEIVENENQLGELHIEKVDRDNHDIKLEGVEFTLKQLEGHMAGQYVTVNDKGEAEYTTDSNARIITDEQGKIDITKLWKGRYELVEVNNPNYGYVPSIETINITVKRRQSTYTVVENWIKYIKLSGYVWEDVQSTKMSTRNDLYNDADYDDGDILVPGITVRLKEGNTVLQETVTDENGAYLFEDVEVDKLPDYYIEFEYDGLIYQNVIPHLDRDNGSKAAEGNNRQEFNNQFARVEGGNSRDTAEVKDANGNTVYNVKYELNSETQSAMISDTSECTILATTDNAGYEIPYERGHGITEVKFINLGIYRRAQADLAISQDLQNVKMEIAGYGHIYEYDQRSQHVQGDEMDYTQDAWNVGVRYRSPYSDLTYTRPIYESDANYYEQHRDDPLKVYLTYKLAIRNEETIVSQVNSMVDYFDKRYTLVSVGTGVDQEKGTITGELQPNVDYYIDSSYSNDTYTKLVINNANVLVDASVSNTDESAMNNTKKYIYLQFELSNENVVEMLRVAKAANNDLSQIEAAGNLLNNYAEITSYTSYTDINKTSLYAAVDKDSVPENAIPGDSSTYEDDTDAAPPIAITLANARQLNGTVFEDNADEGLLESDNVRQGNSTYDEGENAVGGVKVELIDAETGETAKVFDERTEEWTDAVCDASTDSSGNYSIVGYVPGRYKIKYTWGDGTYKIVDGQQVPYEDVVENYKATNLDQATYEAESNNDKFFKDANESTTRTSHALDDYSTRQQIDNELNPDGGYNYTTEVTTRYMTSTTPEMEFELEYADEGSSADEIIMSITLDRVQNRVAFVVNNLDFGITQRPVQSVNFVKSLSKIKIILADGRTLVDATIDENGNMTGSTNYLSYVKPVVENGITVQNGFLRAELDSELIQGATVQMEYKMRTENTSNADYMSQGFYEFGKGYYDNRQNGETEKENDIVTITPSTIVDYLDAKTVYRETDPLNEQYQWEQVQTVEDLKNLGLVDESVTNALETGTFDQELSNGEVQSFEIDENKIYVTHYLQDAKLKPIRRVNNEERPAEGGDVMMAVEKVLNSSEDANFTNQAELVLLTKPGGGKPTSTPGNYVPTKHQQETDDSTSEEVIIVPSTGANRNFVLPITVSIIALVILGLGTYLIIVKVVRKKQE